MKATVRSFFGIFLILALILGFMPVHTASANVVTNVPVYVLDPSWDAVGGGGVFSAYVAPPSYGYVSPGLVGLFDGREAGIIKAGLTPMLDGHFDDEGLFAFIPNVSINALAVGTLSYDVETQFGVNPVWMTIEIDTGVVGNRGDNTIYQHVPTSNPVGWHTVDAGAGQWKKWNSGAGDVGSNPFVSMGDIVAAHTGLNVVRAYLRLGMGDSYANGGTGTVAWVDKATLGGITYDFQINTWYVSTAGSDSNLGNETSPFLTLQHAIAVAGAGDTIMIAPGTYVESGQIVINKSLTIIGADKVTTILKPSADTGGSGDGRGWFLVNTGNTFNLRNVTLDGDGRKVNIGILSHGAGLIENNILKNIGYEPSGPSYTGRGIAFYDVNMTIRGNLLQNIGRIGIYAYGPGVTAGVIDGNTYVGKGVGNWLDYGIEIEGGAVVEVMNNTVSDCKGVATVDGSGSSGMLITTYFGPGATANVHDNIFTNNEVAISVGYDGTDTSSLAALHNKFTGNTNGIWSTNPAVVAEANWWGSIAGAAAGFNGAGTKIDSDPWCGDPGCTFLMTYAGGRVVVPSGTTAAEIQALINNAPAGTTIVLPGEVIHVAGGFTISNPGVTIEFSVGTVILASSPCFTVAASDTTITSPTMGGVCTPSGLSAGIEVNAPVNNLRIMGLEITGGASDGIKIGAAVNNLMVLDNFIHGNAGIGLHYTSAGIVTGLHQAAGNLFMNNGGNGVSNETGATYDLTFNGWGHTNGPVSGDGVSGNVNYTPWTHAAVSTAYVAGSTPAANRVAKNQTIQYQVVMDAKQLMGADFDVNYDATKLSLTNVTDAGLFSHNGSCALVQSAGSVSFCGYRTAELSGDGQVVMTLTFRGLVAGVVTLDVVDTNDQFAMAPVGPSTNAYAAAMTDGSVEVFDLMSILTGNVYLQGRSNYAGSQMALGIGTGQGYGPFLFGLSNSWGVSTVSDVVFDTYNVTVSMEKYLDVTAALGKSVTVTTGKSSLLPVTLRGGDLGSKDNAVTIGDASYLGSRYGGADLTADINGDGRINLLDLAMVGGNFGLTSATAYTTWVP